MSEETKADKQQSIERGRNIWSEDDVLRACNDPDRETIEMKWHDLFGEKLDLSKAVATFDGGDHFTYQMPNGYVIDCAYDGDYLYEPSSTH